MKEDPPNSAKKAIWIDVDNSPHVPLFAPIIQHYRQMGVEVVLTAREHAQTVELLELYGFGGTFKIIGKHYGKGAAGKIRGLFLRARQLASYVKIAARSGLNIAVAVSHGSRSLVLAAWWMRIPVITMYDYEFTETRIFNRFSDKVLIPSQISDSTLDKIGLSTAKCVKYEGIKEELYIRNFEPRTDFRRDFFKSQIVGRNSPESILVVVRPPATTANYHSERSEKLFDDVMRLLAATKNAFTVVMPRTREQEETVRSLIAGIPDSDNCMVLSKAVDGLNLTFAADVLISGGGTMNREAALLGVPVYSIFAGKLGALDAAMEKEGSIRFIRKSEDLGKIRLERRRATGESRNSLTDRVESFVINQIDSFLDAKEKR